MAERTLPPAEEFAEALVAEAPRYGVRVGPGMAARLRDFYAHLSRWNPRLHLVAPCGPREFAARHVLESLAAVPHLAAEAHAVDVGSGAGLPIIPCLVARPDLRATLIEASAKKGVFLREALRGLGLEERARVITARFEEVAAPPDASALTCRALERFTEAVPELVAWAPAGCTLLLFGGAAIGARLTGQGLDHAAHTLPGAERRFLFVATKTSAA